MTHIEYTANADGVEYPVIGDEREDTIVLEPIDERTAEEVHSHAGNIAAVARREVSPDGQRLTITLDRMEAGNSYTRVAVFDREE